MTPVPCRVQVGLREDETDRAVGTIGIASGPNDTIRIITASDELTVTAALSRDEAVAFLLAGANSLGLVLLDAKEAARRYAASRKRQR